MSEQNNDATDDGTPRPGELLQQGLAFTAADIWDAYGTGAREAYETIRRGIPVGQTFDALVHRSCDAYTKLVHTKKPRAARSLPTPDGARSQTGDTHAK